jgi:hypothetical protein
MKVLFGLTLAAAMLSGAARAEVIDKSAVGFEVNNIATISASPAKVYTALLTPSAWWSSKHSFSGDAKNLSIDLAKGCFCEKLPHGYARHMTVIFADEGKALRLSGGLGPMQFTGASGVLAFTLRENEGKTYLTAIYDVGGYARGGLAENFATPVDKVLGEQVERLKKYVETGKPD